VSDPYDLERFVDGQRDVYGDAIEELQAGQKRSHWMWFVFPQIRGLASSPTSQLYAFSSLEEAKAYLADPILGTRLREAAAVVAGVRGRTAREIFGDVDAQKLRSSMTLFARAAPEEAIFSKVLEQYFDGVPDAATESRLPTPRG
jgi:uncharacterized protein (DUF1810 family)